VQRLAVTLTKSKDEEISSGNNGGGLTGGPRYGGDGNDGKPDRERMPPPEGYRIAMWATLTWVTMLFLTLIVIYVWLGAQQSPFVTPGLFWVSTAVVFSCSVTLEIARRALRQRRETVFNRWLRLTMLLGLVFLGVQYLGLRQLSEAGFFATVNKRAWLTFLITGSHGAHLFGGLLALVYLIVKNNYGDWTALRRRATMDTTTIYWHFIGGLWLCLFALLFLWN
jgi:cytochrome c oxidase subunit III